MKRKVSAGILLLITPLLSYGFFCPSNFNQIELGYTLSQVTSACGAPAAMESHTVKPEGPQEWNYYMQPPSDNYMGTVQGPYNSAGNQGGTLKTQFTFDGSGKIININVNGITAPSTAMCSQTIQLGDPMSKVKAACGSPTMVNKTNQDSQAPGVKVDTYTYSGNQTVKLIFEDGKLVRKE